MCNHTYTFYTNYIYIDSSLISKLFYRYTIYTCSNSHNRINSIMFLPYIEIMLPLTLHYRFTLKVRLVLRTVEPVDIKRPWASTPL